MNATTQQSQYPDAEGAARAVAEKIVGVLHEALTNRGRASLVLAGGSTFTRVYQHLAEMSEALDWKKVALFFGDERCVPENDERSNYLGAYKAWLNVFAERHDGPEIYPIKAWEGSPQEVAHCYHEVLTRYGNGYMPTFDVVLLGLGYDGHTLSVFPGSLGWIADNDAVIAHVQAELDPFVDRITLTPATVNHARHVIVMATGEGKREIVTKVLHDPEKQYPISYIEPEGGLELVLDADASPVSM